MKDTLPGEQAPDIYALAPRATKEVLLTFLEWAQARRERRLKAQQETNQDGSSRED